MSLLARVFVGAVVVVGVGACAFKKDDDKVTQDDVKELMQDVARREQKDSDAVFDPSEILVGVVPDDMPTRYKLEISWPVRLPSPQLNVNGKWFENLKGGRCSISVGSGELYHIEFISMSSQGRPMGREIREQRIPVDEIMAEKKILTSDLEMVLGRLFLNERAQIILNGHKLKINAQEIVSANATIKTIDSWEPVVSKQPDSLSGSAVYISADRFRGEMNVWLFGYNGMNGANWDEMIPATAPRAGRNGVKGHHSYWAPGSMLCIKPPTDGTPGEDAPIYPGGDGLDGGATGNFSLFLKEKLQSRISVYLRQGRGGDPGQGSPKFPHGIGGPPGDPLIDECPRARKGADGKVGQDGPPGRRGQDGAMGTVLFHDGEGSRNLNFVVIDLLDAAKK